MAYNVRADLWSSKSELVRDLRILQIRLLCEVREAAAQEADVIRANVVAKEAERISPLRLGISVGGDYYNWFL